MAPPNAFYVKVSHTIRLVAVDALFDLMTFSYYLSCVSSFSS